MAGRAESRRRTSGIWSGLSMTLPTCHANVTEAPFVTSGTCERLTEKLVRRNAAARPIRRAFRYTGSCVFHMMPISRPKMLLGGEGGRLIALHLADGNARF